MLRKFFKVSCASSLLGAFLLTGCDNGANESLNRQAEELRSQLSSATQKSETLERDAATAKKNLNQTKALLDQSQQDRQKLEDTLKKLDKEFSDYKEKYKVSITKKMPGLFVGDFVYNKKIYQDTKVYKIDDESITVEYPDGLFRVKREDLTPGLISMLAMDQTTPVQSEAIALIQEVENHKNGRSSLRGAAPMMAYDAMSGDNAVYANLLRSISVLQNEHTSGSGFVAKQAGHTYFFTSAYMLEFAKPGSEIIVGPGEGDKLVMPKEIEVSDEEAAADLARFDLENTKVPALEILPNSEKLLREQKIVAFENTEGAGAMPFVRGKTGVVSDYWVEIDARLSHGNSGGPVLWEGTSTVIGVVTEEEQSSSGHTPLPRSATSGLHRICIRPDRVEKWRHVGLDRIQNEIATVRRILQDSQILKSLMKFHVSAANKYTYVIQSDPTKDYIYQKSGMAANLISQIRELEFSFTENRQTLEQTLASWQKISGNRQSEKMAAINQAERDAQMKADQAFESFVAAVDRLYGADVIAADPKEYCAFSRRDFKKASKERLDVIELLNKHFAEEIRQFKGAPS